jgi:hypothetical protein
MKRALPYLILMLVFTLVMTLDADAQCAMCKKVAEGKDVVNKGSVAKNLNGAILYLMAIPYFALAFIFRAQIASFFRSRFKKG